MSITLDSKRGKEVANLLYRSFSTTDIHGRNEMPEDLIPGGTAKGSNGHLLFITLTVSIDYQRDAPSLWESARRTFKDSQTKYLFSPKALQETPRRKIISDMQKYKLSKKPIKDADIWRIVGITFYKKWNGDPKNFLQDCNWDSLIILERLRNDTHLYNNRYVHDYPYLRGDKIGPLWLRMLRDNVGMLGLKNLEEVPIPVDIHVARASLSLGIVKGFYKGNPINLFNYIRKAWFESVEGLRAKNKPMIAIDIDQPLWHLSKYGCSKNRNENTGICLVYNRCEAKDFCIRGKLKIDSGIVELKT